VIKMPEDLLSKADFWPMRSKSGNIALMCENSSLFNDNVSCSVFSKGTPLGTIMFTEKELTVFDTSGRRKEVILYGGGYPIRIDFR